MTLSLPWTSHKSFSVNIVIFVPYSIPKSLPLWNQRPAHIGGLTTGARKAPINQSLRQWQTGVYFRKYFFIAIQIRQIINLALNQGAMHLSPQSAAFDMTTLLLWYVQKSIAIPLAEMKLQPEKSLYCHGKGMIELGPCSQRKTLLHSHLQQYTTTNIKLSFIK